MPLIVLYDPEENARSRRIDNAHPMDHEENHVHYWGMRQGNPFQTLDVLWIDRQTTLGTDSAIFANITDLVYTNIDHMYIWVDEKILSNVIQGLVTDTSGEFNPTQAQITYLRSLTVEDVFLAVEMTEHAVWSTNAFQRFGRIVQCVENDIPVIYSAPRDAWRGDRWGRGAYNIVQRFWWERNNFELRNVVEELIRNDEDITHENVSANCSFDIPNCPEPYGYGEIKYQPFSQWARPYLLTLWDTLECQVTFSLLPTTYSTFPDQYGASGGQMRDLFEIIRTAIQHERGIVSQMEYDEMWDELKSASQANVGTDWTQRSRVDRYDQIAALDGFPSSTFHAYGEERNAFDEGQHFSLRSRNTAVASRANSIYAISGSTDGDRNADVIGHLSNLSNENGGPEFTGSLNLPNILVNRNSILAHRLTGHTSANYNVITHSNKTCFMPYLDYQFCRNDVIDPSRPNAGADTAYSRRHILVAFMQDIPSSEYFSNAYWQRTCPRNHYIWSGTADVLIFSDGIFLGELWWPEGVNQLSDVPQVGTPI
jgi:hypothetical protein